MKSFKYKMSKQMFNSMLSTRTETEKKQNPYQFILNLLNENNGLLRPVKYISIYDDV